MVAEPFHKSAADLESEIKLTNTQAIKRGCLIKIAKKEKADVLNRKVLSIRLLCCIIELPQTIHKKAR